MHFSFKQKPHWASRLQMGMTTILTVILWLDHPVENSEWSVN
jgi:hypothetical protein